ncbi:hypothetical protein ACFL6N_02560 [Thermodesulfobacteriota bacterium]
MSKELDELIEQTEQDKAEIFDLWRSTLRVCKAMLKDAEEGKTQLKGSTLKEILDFLRHNNITLPNILDEVDELEEEEAQESLYENNPYDQEPIDTSFPTLPAPYDNPAESSSKTALDY